MKRAEAEKLIGTRFETWSQANGIYTGTLVEVVSKSKGSPWRGKILVDGILAPAQHFEMGQACRRGARVGEVIDIGGISLIPTEKTGIQDYAEVLRSAIIVQEDQLETATNPRYTWAIIGFSDGYAAALECELERQETGVWDRKKLVYCYIEIVKKRKEQEESGGELP